MRPCGKMTTNNKEKVDEFARYLGTVHQTPEDSMFDIDFKREIDRMMEGHVRTKSDITSIDPIQVPQLRELLTTTKSGSSPGEDSISYDILQPTAQNM